MMQQYRLELESQGTRISFSDAYRVYACLLEQIPLQDGSELHTQGETPVSIWMRRDKGSDNSTLTVSLLTEQMCTLFCPILSGCKRFDLNDRPISIRNYSVSRYDSPEELLRYSALKEDPRRVTLHFLTPTAFKQDGRYVIFPQEKLILHSLIQKWNAICPQYPLEDPDAIAALERGIRISDYSLRSFRYPLKGIWIPGFLGSVVLENHLPAALLQIWKALLVFSEYSGVGIKTALGMGQVQISR